MQDAIALAAAVHGVPIDGPLPRAWPDSLPPSGWAHGRAARIAWGAGAAMAAVFVVAGGAAWVRGREGLAGSFVTGAPIATTSPPPSVEAPTDAPRLVIHSARLRRFTTPTSDAGDAGAGSAPIDRSLFP
jgi:hypothetical protein